MNTNVPFLPYFCSFGCSVFCLDCLLGQISVSAYLFIYSIVFCFSHSLFSSVYFWCGTFAAFLHRCHLCSHCFSLFVYPYTLSLSFSIPPLSTLSSVCLSARCTSAVTHYLPICCFWTKSKKVALVPQQWELQGLTSVCLLQDSELVFR